MENVIHFPIKQSSIKSVQKSRMRIECMDCGNTKKFYGRAITHPFIVVERQEHDKAKYDVTEVGYTNAGRVEEIIETCAACGSHELDIQILKQDLMI